MSFQKVFVPEIDHVSRAVNLLASRAEKEFTNLASSISSIDSDNLPLLDSTYTASTAGVAFVTSASYTTLLSITASVCPYGDTLKADAIACIAAPNDTATYCLRLLGGSTTLFEDPLIAGTAFSSRALSGVYTPPGGAVPIFKLQIKRTAGTGDILRTALGIYTQRGYD